MLKTIHSLAIICAVFPPNQCRQLKIGLLDVPGCGLKYAPIGCKKQTIVTMVPKTAWGLDSLDQSLSSTNIKIKAVNVSNQVKAMNPLCHCKNRNYLEKLSKYKLRYRKHKTQKQVIFSLKESHNLLSYLQLLYVPSLSSNSI